MIKAVIFGGTTEGRKLCEVCAEYAIPIRYCAATTDGARQVKALPHLGVHTGRLNEAEMTALLGKDKPALVIDATHPYAEEVSRNIGLACQNTGVSLLRVARESSEEQGYMTFTGLDDLLTWVGHEQGNIFVATGSSHAKAFTRLPDYQNRVWLRVLPNIDSLRTCLDLGYRPERLICMQGPFSEELNCAMFKAADARILVTKNSGGLGGFSEKIRAAKSLDIKIAVLSKPDGQGGISLDEACKRIMELRL